MAQIINVDNNLINTRTGLGNPDYDSRRSNYFDGYLPFNTDNYVFLSRLFRQSWQIRKVCSYFPNEMTKEWGKLIIPSNFNLQNDLQRETEKLRCLFRQGQTFANLYGGCGYVRFIEDGRELEEPVDYKNIKSISYSRLYDRWELNINYDSGAIARDPYDPEYYYFYSFAPLDGKSPLRTGQRIHRDRILRFRGQELPPFEQINNNGWEDSVLQSFLTPLKNYLSGLGYVTESLRNFEVIVLKSLDLHDAIASGNKTLIEERGKAIAQEMSSLRPILMDKNNEDMQIVNRSFTGVVEIVDLAMREMIASSDIDPGEFYKEKDQIKANSKEERLATAGRIKSLQKAKWDNLLDNELKLWLSNTNLSEKDWEWQWVSTYSETEDDKINREFTIAQTMEKYINLGVLTVNEVRKSLFDNPDSIISIEGDIEPPQPQQDNEPPKPTRKPRFIPDGEVLPKSFYEADITLEELIAVEED